ncbi:hypothetical protein [uncultured Brevibacillus sp.]|uniref:hypothetical protein n=1 Tax=uncultured Brevibacillus sp. TaxID=169970 RepID=UPI002595844C|nr:hypothetical protein [uncultured Brevibacillus sp.]
MKKNLKKTSVRLAALGLATAISLSGALLVSANENPTQKTEAQKQESEQLYAGAYKKVTAAEALADKDVKVAIDNIYAQFPETKSYEITAYKDVVSKEEHDKYVIQLEKDSNNFFHFAVDEKTGKVSYTIQSLATSNILTYPNVQTAVDNIQTSHPETKSYEISSANLIDNFVGKFSKYNLTFTEKHSKRSITFGINAKTGEVYDKQVKE